MLQVKLSKVMKLSMSVPAKLFMMSNICGMWQDLHKTTPHFIKLI